MSKILRKDLHKYKVSFQSRFLQHIRSEDRKRKREFSKVADKWEVVFV